MLFLLGRALSLGRRPALLTVLGNAAGTTVQVVAVAAGLGAVARTSVLAFTVIKLLGAAYLVYLGIEAIRHRRDLATAMQGPAVLTSDRRVFREGAVVGVTNPKTVVFMAAVLPQFASNGAGAPLPVQLLLLGLVFVAIAAVLDSIWAVTASRARGWLARSPRRISGIGAASGVVMMGLGARLALTGRPT